MYHNWLDETFLYHEKTYQNFKHQLPADLFLKMSAISKIWVRFEQA